MPRIECEFLENIPRDESTPDKKEDWERIERAAARNSSRLLYVVREFVAYTARVQRIDGRVVKNYAAEMRKALP